MEFWLQDVNIKVIVAYKKIAKIDKMSPNATKIVKNLVNSIKRLNQAIF